LRYSAIIADDEPPARQRLLDLIEDVDWIDCVGVASDGSEAVRLIDALDPDNAFLDIRMPGASGVEVVEKSKHAPHVIFTTAYDRYAVTAFELHAVDYLLKPFSEERFLTAVDRVRETIEATRRPGESTRSGNLVDSADSSRSVDSAGRAREALARGLAPQRRFVRARGKIVPLPLHDIVRLEAQDDYVLIHTDDRQYLVHVRLKDLLDRLDSSQFVRIHRSHVVCIDRIKSLEPYDGHRLLVELADDTSLVASRSGTKLLRALVL